MLISPDPICSTSDAPPIVARRRPLQRGKYLCPSVISTNPNNKSLTNVATNRELSSTLQVGTFLFCPENGITDPGDRKAHGDIRGCANQYTSCQIRVQAKGRSFLTDSAHREVAADWGCRSAVLTGKYLSLYRIMKVGAKTESAVA